SPGYLSTLAFSPDGKTLAAGRNEQTVELREVRTQRPAVRLKGHAAEWPTAVAFAPDGRTLTSAGTDNNIELWNLRLKQVVATLEGHRGRVVSLAFSADGDTLASASSDGTVRRARAASSPERHPPGVT